MRIVTTGSRYEIEDVDAAKVNGGPDWISYREVGSPEWLGVEAGVWTRIDGEGVPLRIEGSDDRIGLVSAATGGEVELGGRTVRVFTLDGRETHFDYAHFERITITPE
jgi:hypothetical protein